MSDIRLSTASRQIEQAILDPKLRPVVQTFFDETTFTATHIAHDPATRKAVIIDSVLDYDPASGRTQNTSAHRVLNYIQENNLVVEWQLETHAHADHLSAAVWLKEKLGGRIAIGENITHVQDAFGKIFNAEKNFSRDGSQFDKLFHDGETFSVGSLPAIALSVPGHTPADMVYIIGEAAFIGDTLFMPDYGTARADFPGGDARQLYRSIQRLLSLPDKTRVFLCHDYKTADRHEFRWETTIGDEQNNIHVHDGVSEDQFVSMRTSRDKTLSLPHLIMPSVQVNMRAGHLPEPEENGVSYIKIPVNRM